MKKTVILCDDDEGILEIAKIVLEDQGYRVLTCVDSRKMFDLVSHEKPNLVLIDLWMPHLNGDVIALTLKNHNTTKNIPIVIISANRDTEEIAVQVGANGYLAKPFDINDLEAIVEKHLS